LARPSVDPAHDALHAIERGAVQGLLEVGGSKEGWARGGAESSAVFPGAAAKLPPRKPHLWVFAPVPANKACRRVAVRSAVSCI
jgi:hypothetical protein